MTREGFKVSVTAEEMAELIKRRAQRGSAIPDPLIGGQGGGLVDVPFQDMERLGVVAKALAMKNAPPAMVWDDKKLSEAMEWMEKYKDYMKTVMDTADTYHKKKDGEVTVITKEDMEEFILGGENGKS